MPSDGDANDDILCPSCGSSALYRYGKSASGKQRFICLMCRRQFIPGSDRRTVADRPVCPVCGCTMHLYKREEGFQRFRCAEYPKCRGFVKRQIVGEPKAV